MYEQTIETLSKDLKTYQAYVAEFSAAEGLKAKGLTKIFQGAVENAGSRLDLLKTSTGFFGRLYCIFNTLGQPNPNEKTAKIVASLLQEKSLLQQALKEGLPDLSKLQKKWTWKLKTLPTPEQQSAYVEQAIESYDGQIMEKAGEILKYSGPCNLGAVFLTNDSKPSPSESEYVRGVANIMIGRAQPRLYIQRVYDSGH